MQVGCGEWRWGLGGTSGLTLDICLAEWSMNMLAWMPTIVLAVRMINADLTCHRCGLEKPSKPMSGPAKDLGDDWNIWKQSSNPATATQQGAACASAAAVGRAAPLSFPVLVLLCVPFCCLCSCFGAFVCGVSNDGTQVWLTMRLWM